MKKKGVVIEKAETKDIETTIVAMVDGAQHRRAKRCEKVLFIKNWHLYFDIVF
jgi:hypothetical protein